MFPVAVESQALSRVEFLPSGHSLNNVGRSSLDLAAVVETPAKIYSPSFSRSDAEFVEALRSGRSDAHAELFRRHHERVTEVLERVLGPDADLLDLVQEVFVHAIVSAKNFRGDASALRAWLVAIAIHRARALIRRRRVWRRFFAMPGESPEIAGPDAASLEQVSALRRAYALFDKLPTDERIALALTLVDEMPAPEVADVCRVSKSTIQRTLVKARRRFAALAKLDPALRELLEEDSL
jgi:RNA polymerase sigma-70 factor, ECF subfamily